MPFFRRSLDRRQVLARPVAPHDARSISSLAYGAARRYLTSSVEDMVALIDEEPTAVLEYDGRIAGIAQAGWRLPPNAWLRALAIDSKIEPDYGVPLLVRQLHQLLPVRGLGRVYITLDEWNAAWLGGALRELGYEQVMEVWSYEKVGMTVPATGNAAVLVRRARPEDLGHVLRLDAECFPAPWGKGAEILGPALQTGPYFAVAEWSGEVIGYTCVTVHQAGLHAHLVRIAVAPAFQGRGVGVRLLAEVIRFCRSRHIDILSLNTQDHNIGAQRLYEWFGFERSAETQLVLGMSLDAGQ